MIYKQIKKIPSHFIIKKVKEFLEEDIPTKDLTTDNIFIDDSKLVNGIILAKSDLVLSG